MNTGDRQRRDEDLERYARLSSGWDYEVWQLQHSANDALGYHYLRLITAIEELETGCGIEREIDE
ncbi:hypothetical protein J4H86_15480 [Spiractinospora alimapuensis]|uniref:hypothetical protein n=1 Tax=Spiractinospora alimapuensis TaxID=2820884 RepID=UPI001F3C85E7|nr:hypothetical protein [Spiractinospora alimapuensis]QVQ50344.1 hypothetical protein J4H86_15480 [Spiractinospora alimapuensis]